MQDRMRTESAPSGAVAEAKSDVAAKIDEGLNAQELDLLRRICDLCGACGNTTTAATETASGPSVAGKAAGARSSVCLCDRRCMPLPSSLTDLRDCYDRLLDVLLCQPPPQQQPSAVRESATPRAAQQQPSAVRESATPRAAQQQQRRRKRCGATAPSKLPGYAEKRKESSTAAQSSPQSAAKKATVSDAVLVPTLRAVSVAVCDKSFRMRLADNGRLREACGRLAEVTYAITKGARLHKDHSEVRRLAAVQALRLLTDIFRHLSEDKTTQEVLAEQRVHAALVPLLSCGDSTTLTNALRALESLAWRADCARSLSALNCVERLLAILDGQDRFRRRLAANMLQALCIEQQAAETVRTCGGIPILLSRLCCKDLPTQIAIAYCLRNLARDDRLAWALRDTGAIPILISHLRTQVLTSRLRGAKNIFDQHVNYQLSDSSSGDTSPPTPPKLHSSSSGSEGFFEDCTSAEDQDDPTFEATADRIRRLRLKVGCCATLAELVKDHRSAQIVVLSNGIHLIAKACLPMERKQAAAASASPDQGCSIPETDMDDALAYSSRMLQLNAIRLLRHLLTDERYRSTLQKMLPTTVLSVLVDVAHYARNLSAYDPVVNAINSLSAETLAAFQRRVNSQHQHPHDAIRVVRNFEILEVLGSGAFGCVYKVRRLVPDNDDFAADGNRQQQQQGGRRRHGSSFTAEAPLYALKEVALVACRNDDHGMSELAILKEKLSHPNVVQYYDAFIDDGKLFILMELVEGVPLAMELKSRKQQGKHLSEKKIWHYFMQMIMALRYLHKEKRIVHRDLTPNNIMLTHENKVIITDFGLARKRKSGEEVMLSAVGTLLYSCPEIVSSNAYDDKADIWSAGCILYQMCALEPPFDDQNVLVLAKRIAGGQYKPMPSICQYSSQIHMTIARCLTVDPVLRPDVIGLAATLTNQLMCHADRTSRKEALLRRRFDNAVTALDPLVPRHLLLGSDDELPLGQGELRCSDDKTDDDDDDDGRPSGEKYVEQEEEEETQDAARSARRLNKAAGASPPALPPPVSATREHARLHQAAPSPSPSSPPAHSAAAAARGSTSKTAVYHTKNVADRRAIIESMLFGLGDSQRKPSAAAAAAATQPPRRSESHLKATAAKGDKSSASSSSSPYSTSSRSTCSSFISSLSADITCEGDDEVFLDGCDTAMPQAVIPRKASKTIDEAAASAEAQQARSRVRPTEAAAAAEAVSVALTAAPRAPGFRSGATSVASKPEMHGSKSSASRGVGEKASAAAARSSAPTAVVQRPGATKSSAVNSTFCAASASPANTTATAELVPNTEPGVSAHLLRVRVPQSLLHSVDPTQALLQAMSKLEYVTQLPPADGLCPRRFLVGAFKRWLYARGYFRQQWMKEELRKYVSQSRERIDMQLDPMLESKVLHHFTKGNGCQSVGAERFERERRGAAVQGACSAAALRTCERQVEAATAVAPGFVTYQLLHMVVESLLQESNYYRDAKIQSMVDIVDRV